MTSSSRRAFSVRVFLPDGDPDGIKVIEKSNWTGSGLVVPRALFPESKSRPELGRAGVYVLVGVSEQSHLPQVYIGEGDPVRPRLEQHAKLKDFWTHAIAFTSKDQNLNKAHVQRLESRLVELARTLKRCVLDNGNAPQPPSLSEADTAEVESFLADILLCLPILGYGFFEPATPSASRAAHLVLRAPTKGIEAKGFESPQGFVVLQGSKAVKDPSPTIHPYMQKIREELVTQGVFRDAGATYETTQDYSFASPSTAAGVLLGRTANGRIEWKTDDGRTLKDVQESEINT